MPGPLLSNNKTTSWDILSFSAIIIGVVLFLGVLFFLIRFWNKKTKIVSTIFNRIYMMLKGLDDLLKKVCKFALLIFFITLKIFFCLGILALVYLGFRFLYDITFN